MKNHTQFQKAIRILIALPLCFVLRASCRQLSRRAADQIKLAIQPQCGTLASSQSSNFNAGIDLATIKTIFSFGDSWTTTGRSDGGTARPAVGQGTNPLYGGRASNGPVWIENLASDGRALKNYAIGGATVDRTLWKARARNSDMIAQVNKFLSQNIAISPASSLATLFFGINDYAASSQGPGTMAQAGSQLLNQAGRLMSAGITQFLVVVPALDRKAVREFDDVVWNGMKAMQQSKAIKFAFVDLVPLFKAISSNPGLFGYKSDQACLKSVQTTVGGCPDPDDYLYWIPAHPQYQTHRLIADWVRAVLTACRG